MFFFIQPQFLLALSQLLAKTDEQQIVRQAAGIQLKNCLVAKDASVKQQYNERWYALDENVRSDVKEKVSPFLTFYAAVVRKDLKGYPLPRC